MASDPEPHFRCRCVHRWQPAPDEQRPADPYYDRCPTRPTQEDGLCNHCRQPAGACTECAPERTNCCRHSTQRRTLVDLSEPCYAVTTEAPF